MSRKRTISQRLDAITVEEWREIWEAGADGIDEAFFDPGCIPQMRDKVREALNRDRTAPPRRGPPDVVDLINGADDGDAS